MPRVLLILLATVIALLAGCTEPAEDPAIPPIRVGVGSTVEQQTLAGLTQVALEAAGQPVSLVRDLGDTVTVRGDATRGDIDLFWDYTGAAWTLALGRSQPFTDPQESFEAVRAADDDNGLEWLTPSDANATLALFVRAVERPPGDAGTLTWLAGQLAAAEGGLCADGDYLSRPGGYEALADAYAISTDLVPTAAQGTAKALTSVAMGDCFAALAPATSGTAVNAGLVPVIDDQRFFPAFVVAPVARADGPASTPTVTAALQDLATRLDTPTLASLNAQVVTGTDPAEVAEAFLSEG